MEKEKTKKNPLKIILNTIFYTVIVLVIIVAVLLTVTSFSAKSKGYSQIFGYMIQSVQTASMSKYNEDGSVVEPLDESVHFETGDLIFSKEISDSEKDNLQVGDIVSFYFQTKTSSGQRQTIIVTHQIVAISKDFSSPVYTLKGTSPQTLKDETQNVLKSDIISQYTGSKIPGFGKVTDFLKSDTGFLLVIVLPLFAFLIYQIIYFVYTVIKFRKENSQQIIEEKAKELLAQQQQQAPPVNNPDDEEKKKAEMMEQAKIIAAEMVKQMQKEESGDSEDNKTEQ